MTRPVALPQIGALLAEKYRVLRVVADGGMGVVFEAHHELLGKNVALKFPLPELAHLPSVVDRFLAEARLCARIENEHVVRVLDVSKLDGLPYIVMELVTGVSLASEMGTPWPPAKAAAFAVQVLEGLEAVHALGVVHRDVKPENVLVVSTPRGPLLKLIDFGIAKDSLAKQAIARLTRAGALLGTPAYMAPEQIRDALSAGSAADLYAVGILLFEMLSGASPFTATTLEELTEQALSGHLRKLSELVPSTPRELVEIVARATALSASDRFASASDFKLALYPFAEGWAARASSTASGMLSEPELQTKTVLRTSYADAPAPSLAAWQPALGDAGRRALPITVPAPAGPSARKASHTRVLASAAIGAALLLALVAIALAVRSAQRKGQAGTAPPPFATLAPETQIAPLDTESPDPSAAVSTPRSGLKHVEARPATSTKVPLTTPPAPPPAPLPSTVQVDGRRFHSCNSDGKASEVVVDLHVADDGSVSRANAVSSSASAPVTECVLSECRLLRFAAHDGPEQVARVPIELSAPTREPGVREFPDWLPGRQRRRRPVE